MLTLTLKSAIAHHACEPAYTLMKEALGPGWELDAPFPLLRVLDMRGLKDTLWALRCVADGDEKRRVVSLWLADVLERIEHLMTDERSRAIIPLLREHAISPVSQERWKLAAAAAAYDAYAYANDAYAYANDAEREWQTERLRFYLEAA